MLLAVLSVLPVELFDFPMWCSTCQQDVPGLGSPSSGGELRCGKCGGILGATEHLAATARESGSVAPAQSVTSDESPAFERLLRCPPLPEDDWTLEAELRGVQRLLSSLKSRPPAGEAVLVHRPQMALPGWHQMPAVEPDANDELEPAEATAPQPRTNTAAWTILSLSLAVFACGAVLLVWSLLGQRDDLWPVGLPVALIGQAGMILGLVLQIDGLTGRRATEDRTRMRRGPARAPAIPLGRGRLP